MLIKLFWLMVVFVGLYQVPATTTGLRLTYLLTPNPYTKYQNTP